MRSDVAARAEELAQQRVPFVHATVVRAQHPTSAHAGDAAVVYPDGSIEGFVGGTCAEGSVRVHALEVLEAGEPVLLRIRPGIASTTSEEGAVTVVNPCHSGGSLDIFLEPRRPTPRVVVVGQTPVARALAAIGGPLGFLVELIPGEEAAPRADDAAVVVASHGRGEEPALEAALRAGVPYVGLVASHTRATAVLGSLDVGEELRARVHSPAGLDIGARTAEEIAMSILAELVAERARARGSMGGGGGDPALLTNRPAVAVDPVCGMTVVTSADAVSAEHAGRPVYFCSAHCRAAFVDDLVRHAAAPDPAEHVAT